MNERVKELAEQAGIAVWGDAGYMYHPGNTLDSTVMAKFAELIVRECMRMCDVAAVGYETHGRAGEANGCYSAKEYIEEHFGVEE
jgi:hypothetical protein